MLTDNEYDGIMIQADEEEYISFLEALRAVEYIKAKGVYRYPELTALDWIANILMLMYAIEE